MIKKRMIFHRIVLEIITWSTNGKVIKAGKLLTVETVTKIEAAVS